MAVILFRQSSVKKSSSSEIAEEPSLFGSLGGSHFKAGIMLFHSLPEYLGKSTLPRHEGFHTLTAWKRTPAGHVFFCWRADKVEYDLCLVQITGTGQYGFLLKHLTKHTTAGRQ